MSEENNEPKGNEEENNPEAQPPAEAKKTEETQLTPEQLELAFKHPRFKELSEAKKERDKLKKEFEKKEEEEMKRKGELEELLKKKESEVEQLNTRFATQAKHNAVLAEAAKKGVIDPEAVVRLIDADKIELDENGNPSNVTEVVDTLLSEKSYLVGKKQDVGSETSTSNNSDKPTYKQSELREKIQSDVNYLKENRAEIDAAYAEGRVDLTA